MTPKQRGLIQKLEANPHNCLKLFADIPTKTARYVLQSWEGDNCSFSHPSIRTVDSLVNRGELVSLSCNSSVCYKRKGITDKSCNELCDCQGVEESYVPLREAINNEY